LPGRVEAERARLVGAGFRPDIRQFDGGHRLDDATLAGLATAPGAPIRTHL
jgi:hypothetical protein